MDNKPFRDPPQNIPLKPYINTPQNALDASILSEMRKEKIVGISAAFVIGNRVAWANGYGWADLERGELTTPDTIYRIASVSKTITATALMQLWERGLFGLDDDISNYLGYRVRNPHYPNDKITFKMLLTHTSSILDFGGYNAALNSPNPPLLRDLLLPGGTAYSSSTWGSYRPGTKFSYSNFGVGIIGALVEMISGEHFDQYAINHIFRPLGMDASYVLADIVHINNVAVLYHTSGNSMFTPACDYLQGRRPQRKAYTLPLGNYYIGPAGAVRTSVMDLAKFMIAHMNGGVYDGVRILKKETADLMHQFQWYGSGLEGFYKQMGLMFHITDSLAGRRLTGHAGEACGLLSDMYFDLDENVGVIFMTNGGYYQFLSNGFSNIEEAVINDIFAQLVGPPKPITRVITVLNGDNKVVVNGRDIFYPVSPDTRAGELFLPAITLADALETEIVFDENTNTLTLSRNSTVLRAKIGEKTLEVNSRRVLLENPIYFKEGTVMLPLIKVSQSFGGAVSYNTIKNEIIVTIRRTIFSSSP